MRLGQTGSDREGGGSGADYESGVELGRGEGLDGRGMRG